MAGVRPDDIADVHRLVGAHRPDYRIDSVVLIGAGLDNRAYEVNGELIVRFRLEPDPAQLRREARLLAAVAEVSPLPVPRAAVVAEAPGCLVYGKLPGVPVLELPRDRRSDHARSTAATLGDLLTALHAVPVDHWADLVDDDRRPLAEWRSEAADTYRSVVEHIPATYRRAVQAFLDAPPPHDRYPPVFSHNDLGIEHVLVDPVAGTVTGIIDWSDAAIVDPATDFGRIYRDLGPAGLHSALGRYRTGADRAALPERAVFYARCTVLEDLAYGIETGRSRYADHAAAALPWLFPA